jgi:YrbI family 3-deoxy-D-manno-octulosonate 8-phosphate phosphatase
MKKIDFKQADIELIVYDFDGVMTDNTAIVDENGKESVIVNRGDGFGVSQIKKLNIEQVIISTEPNKVVIQRGKKLGIETIHDVGDKKTVLSNYCKKNNIPLAKVLFIGNDLNDYEAMTIAGYTACPQDAEPEIKEYVNHIFDFKGGKGVIRELYRELTV